MEFFIAPQQNIVDHNSREWQYHANLSREDLRARWETPIGQTILGALKNGMFSRQAIEHSVGRFNGHFDLRGIALPGMNLSGLDLSEIDFFASDFSGASLARSILSDSFLSECNIRGASFDWAKLDKVLMGGLLVAILAKRVIG